MGGLILGALSACLVFSLLMGTVSLGAAAVLGLLAGIALSVAGHHHGGAPVTDALARRSRLAEWNAPWKAVCTVTLLLLCLLSPAAQPPLLLALALGALVCLGGGLRLRDYLRLLSLPVAFLLLSGLALLWDYAAALGGALSVPFFNGWLVVTTAAQQETGLVLARALGAVSCLYFLSLTTPLPALLAVARRVRVPAVVLDLAVLMYRYIFILLSAYGEMKYAAASRLGYGGLKQSLRTTGLVYGSLLARSFRRASACFDAMESRCYQGDILFLERAQPVTAPAVLALGGLLTGMLGAIVFSI